MKKTCIFLSIIIFMLMSFCDSPVEEEKPTLTSISPNSKVSQLPTFTLTAIGTNFVQEAKIVFNGTEKNTTFISTSEITCQISPDDIKDTMISYQMIQIGQDNIKAQNKSVPVLVRNPSLSGGDSNTLYFTILNNHEFNAPKPILDNAGFSLAPDMCVDHNGNINVVWSNNSTGNNEIYFSRSSDNGTNWSPYVNISNNIKENLYPAIDVNSSGIIYIVWHVGEYGNEGIYFTCSSDAGTTWSLVTNLWNNSDYSRTPAIAVEDNGNINVIWKDTVNYIFDIYFSRSSDKGTTWTQAIGINSEASDHNLYAPAIAAKEGGYIFAVWSNYWTHKYTTIYFSKSINFGQTWSEAEDIRGSLDPDIVVDVSGNINIVCANEYLPYNYMINFTRSTDDGQNWSKSVNISNIEYSHYPALCVDSAGNINVVYRGNGEIVFNRSTSNGVSWSEPLYITDNMNITRRPGISADNVGDIYVVWAGIDGKVYFTSSKQ